MIKQFVKKLIQYYIDLIVSWYRKIKTYFNLNYEIKKYHDSFDKPKKPVIKEVGKFGDKDWSISIGDINEQVGFYFLYIIVIQAVEEEEESHD